MQYIGMYCNLDVICSKKSVRKINDKFLAGNDICIMRI